MFAPLRNLMPATIHIPLNELAQQISRHALDKDDLLVLHGRSGNRNGQGVQVLKGMR